MITNIETNFLDITEIFGEVLLIMVCTCFFSDNNVKKLRGLKEWFY